VRLPTYAARLNRPGWPRNPQAPRSVKDEELVSDYNDFLHLVMDARFESSLACWRLTGKWLPLPLYVYQWPLTELPVAK